MSRTAESITVHAAQGGRITVWSFRCSLCGPSGIGTTKTRAVADANTHNASVHAARLVLRIPN